LSANAPVFSAQSCPSCGNPASAPLVVASNPKAESLSFEDIKPYWHGFFKEKTFFSYHRCIRCKTLYCRSFFSQDQLDQLYHQMPDNTAGVPLQALRKTQEGYFRLLQRYSPLQGSYLEVGPDIGLFTAYAVKEGKFDRFWLFEPNTGVRATLETLLAGKRYDILPEFLNVKKLPDNSLSVVVMVHVLDHLTDPKVLLEQLKKKLSPGAVLLFVTHDEASLLAKVTRSRWPPYCLQHPLLFNPKTISTLLQSAGFNVLAVKKSANYYPAVYLAKNFLWAAGLKKITLPKWTFPTIPLKLGNIMTVAQTPKEV
jgi:SAM-dependent methyltransferase